MKQPLNTDSSPRVNWDLQVRELKTKTVEHLRNLIEIGVPIDPASVIGQILQVLSSDDIRLYANWMVGEPLGRRL